MIRCGKKSTMLAVCAFVLAGLLAPAGSSASAAPANERLSVSQLRKLLNAQDLPTTERLPVTEESHPFNGAAWQNKPINLARYGSSSGSTCCPESRTSTTGRRTATTS
jgi:hypothetical protein